MKNMMILMIPMLLVAQDCVLQKDILSAGGRKMTSTDYILTCTVSQAAAGKTEDTDYKAVIGFWHPCEAFPPASPYIVKAEKSGVSLILTWNKITTDTLGSPEIMHYYAMYRNASPSFVPEPSDSIGYAVHPDTIFTDGTVLTSAGSRYYLIKAVDWTGNRSSTSNMGFKFNKPINENPLTTDRNWVSLPWHTTYASVSGVTSDLSPAGEPLTKLTNLRNDNLYESWLWDPDFEEWYGTDFAITSGRGYEMVTIRDDTLMLVGSNDPDGLVSLNENPTTTDRNWVSIPYNHVYSVVSDITAEYSSSGYPLTKITNLRNDNLYESWLWDPDFGEWYGTDFSIECGRAYEMVTVVDTTWNPTEFSNEATCGCLAIDVRKTNLRMFAGESNKSDRVPSWIISESENGRRLSDARAYSLAQKGRAANDRHSESGVPHVVRMHFDSQECNDITFIAYRPDKPYDVLTDDMVGCGVARKGNCSALWFDTGNFATPWKGSEEVILVVEAHKQGRRHYAVRSFELDEAVDIQDLETVKLAAIPEPTMRKGVARWHVAEDKNVIGFSLYHDGVRLNNTIIMGTEYPTRDAVNLTIVVKGGHETAYGSQPTRSIVGVNIPGMYEFSIQPNPFVRKTTLTFALPRAVRVTITIYDVAGRTIKTLIADALEPGYYQMYWSGDDDKGRRVACGVYFISMETHEFRSQKKIIVIE